MIIEIEQNFLKEQLCNLITALFFMIVIDVGNIYFKFLDDQNIIIFLIAIALFYIIDLFFDLFVYFLLKKRMCILIDEKKIVRYTSSFFQLKEEEIVFKHIVFCKSRLEGWLCYEAIQIETVADKYYINKLNFTNKDFEKIKKILLNRQT